METRETQTPVPPTKAPPMGIANMPPVGIANMPAIKAPPAPPPATMQQQEGLLPARDERGSTTHVVG